MELLHNVLNVSVSETLRLSNSHGLTVRLTVWAFNSRSHDLAHKSHGESENLEILSSLCILI